MSRKKPLLVFGAGGHAVSCLDVLEQAGVYQIAGLIASRAEMGKRIHEFLVIGSDDDLPALRQKYEYAFIAIGQIKSPQPRVALFDRLSTGGWIVPTIVSTRAYVSPHSALGAGTIVMHGAIVNAGATVGRNCIINSNALIEHDVVIGDHCHVSTSATINGGAHVGSQTFVGSGTVVRQGVTLGERSVIGMGQSIRENCAPGSLINRQ